MKYTGSLSAIFFMSSNATPIGRYDSGSCAEVWSVTMSIGASRSSNSGKTSAALPSRPIDSGRLASRASTASAQRVVDRLGAGVEVALLDAALDAALVAVHADRDAVVHGDGQRLRAAHAAEARGERDRAGQRAVEPLARDGAERLVGALQDALGADVDPRARGHLAVHRQPGRLELAELLPVRPVANEIRVRDQHPRRPLVGAEHADRLAGLHQHGLVVLECAQRGDDRVERLPAARGATGAAVDHEILGMLGDLGIEVVHQHAQRRFLLPALAGDLGTARGADGARR